MCFDWATMRNLIFHTILCKIHRYKKGNPSGINQKIHSNVIIFPYTEIQNETNNSYGKMVKENFFPSFFLLIFFTHNITLCNVLSQKKPKYTKQKDFCLIFCGTHKKYGNQVEKAANLFVFH